MDGTQAHVMTSESVNETRLSGILGGSLLEGAGAIATIALAIVGLAGIFSSTMAAIAAIVVGAAVLMEAGTLTVGGLSTQSGLREMSFFRHIRGMDFQGGLATVILGILALLGIAPQTLLAVAVIALGATFLFSESVLVGLGGVVLGILAVVGESQLTLVLVGFLIFGAGLLFAGTRHAVSAATGTPAP